MKKRKSILTNIVNLASTMVLKSPKTRAMTDTRSIVEEILEMIRTKLTEVENAEN